jgi:hypothetical protein
MLNIEIKTIPDKKQRYNTVGDYWEQNGKELVRISDMQNWKYEILIAVHEILEASLCKARGIHEKVISNFDKKYEKKRKYRILDEPGNDLSAPYYKEHQFALKIEKMFAKELGVDWKEYNKLIVKLDDQTSQARL